MMMPDVNVYLIDMPESIKEMVSEDLDDSYTIYLNARLSYDDQLRAYDHAMGHIINEDFEEYDVQLIESAAHRREG